MPATTYHARDDEALKNGSFFVKMQSRVTIRPTFMQYMNGDFMGYRTAMPDDLKTYTKKEALKLKRNK